MPPIAITATFLVATHFKWVLSIPDRAITVFHRVNKCRYCIPQGPTSMLDRAITVFHRVNKCRYCIPQGPTSMLDRAITVFHSVLDCAITVFYRVQQVRLIVPLLSNLAKRSEKWYSSLLARSARRSDILVTSLYMI